MAWQTVPAVTIMFSSLLKRLTSKEAPTYQLPPGVRIYAVGDIHGNHAALKGTLRAIEEDAKDFEGERIIEVFLGDYIDRGMESREVLDLLLQPRPAGHERICLMGNHEATLLKFLQEPETIRSWSHYGGYATLASYGIPIPRDLSEQSLSNLHRSFIGALPTSHLVFIENLLSCYAIGDYYFVHAGIKPGIPLDKQETVDLLCIRDDFTRFDGYFPQYIVHGHTPVESVEIRHNRANLDLSNSIMRQIGCLKLEGNERKDFTVSVHSH